MIKLTSILSAAFCALVVSQIQPQKMTVNNKNSAVQEITSGVSTVTRSGTTYDDNVSFAHHYFSHLLNNYGSNVKGSCPFVAAEMMLDYYDTFLNDGIIPEAFDSNPAHASNLDFRSATVSPGSKKDSDFITQADLCGHNYLKELTTEEYWHYIQNHKHESVHLNLLSRYLDPNDPTFLPPLSAMFGGYPSPLEYVGWSIEGFINQETELNANDLNIQSNRIEVPYSNLGLFESLAAIISNPVLFGLTVGTLVNQSNNLKNQIKSLVNRGIPVMVTGMPSDLSEVLAHGLHTFVAHGYDSTADKILCNAGWQQSSTMSTGLIDSDYQIVLEIMWFEPTIQHEECNNYIHGQQPFGPSDKLYVNEINVPNQMYLDVLPTFTWDSYANVDYYNLINKSYNLYFCDEDINILYTKRGIVGNSYTLTEAEYNEVISQLNGNTCRVFLELISGTEYDDQQDIVLCNAYCSLSRSFEHKIQVKPGEWGFAERYYFENEGIKTSTKIKNNLGITTSRLRCGYIQSSYVVLSPRRAGAGRAYFQMEFDKPVFHFSYSICLWSANENLNGSAILQVMDANGNWTTIQNLLALNLTTKEQGVKRYNVLSEPNPNNPSEFGRRGFYGIRFETTATATGSNNKGRLCIDDLLFDIRQPLTNPNGTTASSEVLSQYYAVATDYGRSTNCL